MKKTKVFVISDTHFPFHNKKGIKDMLKILKKERPTHVIQIGDLLDQYVFSKYSRSLNITADNDIIMGLINADDMWKDIKSIVPTAKCYQILGNHDVRFKKRVFDNFPELESLYDFDKIYDFKGVSVLKSDRDFLIIDGVVYVHGWLSKSIDHAKYFNKPVVHGHRHRMAIETDGKIWSMDVGFLADEKAVPLNYTMSKLTKWTLGCGVVENRKPRLIFL